MLVEARAAGLSRRATYFAGDLVVQGLERYGQVRVVDGGTRAALPKAYVKVYAELEDGQVRFHKDGYTDLRGRFDYVSLSGRERPAGPALRGAGHARPRRRRIQELDPPVR